MKRIAIFAQHEHPATEAITHAIAALGIRPLFRNERLFSSHPSQQEDFDAVVVIGDSEECLLVADTHRERDIPVFEIADVESTEELRADLGAVGFLDFIGGALVEQRVQLEESIGDITKAAEAGAQLAQLPRIADLPAHLATLDAASVRAMQARDTRRTAASVYEARLTELEPPTPSAEETSQTPPVDPPAPPAS